ncbi:unnamed protein product [Rotaria magnacalcarata]|uniref:BTB domain-containing protein n=3 Tax=Rotaria magnacalcarata TaxID=392030 RepID=A0A814W3N7_9BILA|nr:unnamed protein product [Rotaria magnacalcarata]CAF1684330.1 unnamed protein product [Rotaria magnacalcarata]CAF2054909.1 unnamed protein product [Rotaria magnacalcarata]CAF3894507.1 unnamed protein product [Rotaria magnacalcarata]CAF3898654.1 unnamed protein product [Rotaria magnacalcarata]
MYASIQTVCGCHGYLLFESIHCDRCRSLIPFQLSEESLIDNTGKPDINHGGNVKVLTSNKHGSNVFIPYQRLQKTLGVTTGHVRFRALCPFCNSPTYVLRYYCKRERVYYHLRIQQFGENEPNMYKSIAETQNMSNPEPIDSKQEQTESSLSMSGDDSVSLSGTLSQQPPSTIVFDQNGVQSAKETQIKNEKTLYPFNDIEGDLFDILRNGLFYDTILQCEDSVKIQAHRCILGGRSAWFRNLLGEHHNLESQGDYVLQISIDDVKSDVMNEILNFMYTNRCLISLKNASSLLIVAKRFGLNKLVRQIGEFLLFRLTTDNALEMFVSAHESGSETLKAACIRIINRNAEKIKRTEKWKKFKADYVDLVPELYENRVERPPHAQQAFLPDVFSAPVMLPESIHALSQLYENPIKHRAPSPTSHVLPPPKQRHKTLVHNSQFQGGQQSHGYEPITKEATGPFHQRNGTPRSAVYGRESPVKKQVNNNNNHTNARRPVPSQPTGPHLTRPMFPAVKPSQQPDIYRRQVNVHGKNAPPPTNNQRQKNVNNQVQLRTPPSVSARLPKTVSPTRYVDIRRSPAYASTSPEENVRLGRVVSVETME